MRGSGNNAAYTSNVAATERDVYKAIINKTMPNFSVNGYYGSNERPVSCGITTEGVVWCVTEASEGYIARLFTQGCSLTNRKIQNAEQGVIEKPYHETVFNTLNDAAAYIAASIFLRFWKREPLTSSSGIGSQLAC